MGFWVNVGFDPSGVGPRAAASAAISAACACAALSANSFWPIPVSACNLTAASSVPWTLKVNGTLGIQFFSSTFSRARITPLLASSSSISNHVYSWSASVDPRAFPLRAQRTDCRGQVGRQTIQDRLRLILERRDYLQARIDKKLVVLRRQQFAIEAQVRNSLHQLDIMARLGINLWEVTRQPRQDCTAQEFRHTQNFFR